MIDLNKLIREASWNLERSGDKKVWVKEAEMRALIAAGAKVVRNYRQIDGTHLTEAIFKDIYFTHSGEYQLIHPLVSDVH